MARPRDPDVDTRVLAAVRGLVADRGAEQVTIEAVAQHAGVSRPTIYRRWPTRAELLFAAQTNASVSIDFPDTGSLRGDLTEAMLHLAGTMAIAERSVVAEQFGRMIADASFAEHVWSTRWGPDRDVVRVVWDRAVHRGEVAPHTDGDAVLDDLVAVCVFRVLVGHRMLARDEVAVIVDRVLDGVLLGA